MNKHTMHTMVNIIIFGQRIENEMMPWKNLKEEFE